MLVKIPLDRYRVVNRLALDHRSGDTERAEDSSIDTLHFLIGTGTDEIAQPVLIDRVDGLTQSG